MPVDVYSPISSLKCENVDRDDILGISTNRYLRMNADAIIVWGLFFVISCYWICQDLEHVGERRLGRTSFLKRQLRDLRPELTGGKGAVRV